MQLHDPRLRGQVGASHADYRCLRMTRRRAEAHDVADTDDTDAIATEQPVTDAPPAPANDADADADLASAPDASNGVPSAPVSDVA
jgi:hypothetical protein